MLDRQLAAAVSSTALDGVTGPQAAVIWPTLDVTRRRAIVETLVTVTIERGHRGTGGAAAGAPAARQDA